MKARLGVLCAAAAAGLFLSGCVQIHTFKPNEVVFSKYDETNLGVSTAADVLGYLQDPELELLSQSENVAVAWGEQEDGETHWFNMVTFADEDLTAIRKYAFALVEKKPFKNAAPRPTFQFEAAVIMPAEILAAEYPSQNARFIAVFDELRDMFHDDAAEVTADSETLESSAIMVNRMLNAVFAKFGSSPALAARLPQPEGLEFLNPSLGDTRIRMLIEDNLVRLKVRSERGWFQKLFEDDAEVMEM